MNAIDRMIVLFHLTRRCALFDSAFLLVYTCSYHIGYYLLGQIHAPLCKATIVDLQVFAPNLWCKEQNSGLKRTNASKSQKRLYLGSPIAHRTMSICDRNAGRGIPYASVPFPF